jgi:hypothetical protein
LCEFGGYIRKVDQKQENYSLVETLGLDISNKLKAAISNQPQKDLSDPKKNLIL